MQIYSFFHFVSAGNNLQTVAPDCEREFFAMTMQMNPDIPT
jgi:hypothetical protein